MPRKTRYDLNDARTAVLDAAGEAEVTNVGPRTPNERWTVWYITNLNEGFNLRVFKSGRPSPSTFLAATTGSVLNLRPDVSLEPGEALSFRWAGLAGSEVTLVVRGFVIVPGRVSYGRGDAEEGLNIALGRSSVR